MNNILTVAMHQFNTDLDGALAWAAVRHKEVEARFLSAYARVPSFGPAVDAQLAEYIEHIANWPRCNVCWNFESGRYFGSRGAEYQRTRLVPLLPKRGKPDPARRRELVEVPLIEKLELAGPAAQLSSPVLVPSPSPTTSSPPLPLAPVSVAVTAAA